MCVTVLHSTCASGCLARLAAPSHTCTPPQVDFHSEVTILETLAPSPRACEMFDYGLDPGAEAMYLVLRDYRCSLK